MASAMAAIGCGVLRIPKAAWYLLQAATENRHLQRFGISCQSAGWGENGRLGGVLRMREFFGYCRISLSTTRTCTALRICDSALSLDQGATLEFNPLMEAGEDGA